MVTKSKKQKQSSKSKPGKRYVGKPGGVIQQRVQQVGPEKFGIVAVDCAKKRSRWFLCDYYGRVIVEPTTVEHNAGSLKAMTQQIQEACQAEGITDTIAAVEMTGVYHRPVQAALRKAGFDTRTVHPFASSHYRKPLHPDLKTDDNDLEAIFHAAINGYGLALLEVDPVYRSLQRLARHRRNLVKQKARLQIQIRALMHQSMPGYADLFEDDKLFNKSIAMPIAKHFSSAASIKRAGSDGIAKYLRSQKIRFQIRTIDRVTVWASIAADPDPLAPLLTDQWKQLAQLHALMKTQVEQTEREMAAFLVKTPYVLLLSVTGINVVSAGELAGEAGPIEHYASATALNGRAGLYPSRYQSDEVDRNSGMAKSCNRRLRAACVLVAKNLIKCHTYYRGLAALWKTQKIATVDQQCRIANRSNRMVFQIVSGRQLWRGKGIDREYLLFKLREFHRTHHSTPEQTVADMTEAFAWLPKSAYGAEAKPLEELAKKKGRGAKSIGDLLLPLLIRLGVGGPSGVESDSSEARSPH